MLSYEQEQWGPAVGGLIVGIGVIVMHYVGMRALDVQGDVQWTWYLVAASILFACVFSAAAVHLAARRRDRQAMIGSALLLTLAIVLLHFTAMGAVTVIPNPAHDIDPLAVSRIWLAVAGATLSILGMSSVAVFADGRVREQNLRLERRSTTCRMAFACSTGHQAGHL